MKLCMSCGSPVSASADTCPRCHARFKSRTDKLIGTTFADKYYIEDHLGTGGMCDVYRARHVQIGKQVAIKVLKRELAADPKIAQRFEQEAMAASRVRHPNAIDVTDFGIAQGNIPFIVMELVDGHTLGELLRRDGPMAVERAANMIRQVCGALEVAHGVGVIHRDIKPDNILIADYEGGDWVEVADFGVAKIQEDVNRRAALTGANFIIGTPRYMSPEQCEERPVDARSDIYSLGVVVYEMLTGEAPFEGNSTRLLIAHSVETPAPLRQKRPDLPEEVERVVMKALEKDPERRPQSANEFAREFAVAAGLIQEADVEPGRRGPFSRMSVPLGERDSITPLAPQPFQDETPGDEETLVRSRQGQRAQPSKHTETIPDLDDLNPYHTHPEIAAAGRYDTKYSQARSTAAADEGPDPRPMPNTKAIAGAGESASRKKILFAGLAAVLVIAFIVAYLASASRFKSANPAPAGANPEAGPPPAPRVEGNSTPATSVGPAPAPKDDPTQSEQIPNEIARVDTGRIRKAVVATMGGWAKTLEARNLNAHIDHYAPTLHTYYLERGVNRGYVRSDKARALSSFSKLSFGFNNIEVRVDRSGKKAIATYDKSWKFEGERPWSGTVRERLWLENIGGRWRITGERDLKVY